MKLFKTFVLFLGICISFSAMATIPVDDSDRSVVTEQKIDVPVVMDVVMDVKVVELNLNRMACEFAEIVKVHGISFEKAVRDRFDGNRWQLKKQTSFKSSTLKKPANRQCIRHLHFTLRR